MGYFYGGSIPGVGRYIVFGGKAHWAREEHSGRYDMFAKTIFGGTASMFLENAVLSFGFRY